ncbi:MAG: heavy-metal-associated domain-containing protein [Rhizobacter sp.]|nr:heavy-metal-associated domain-containing protein [Chlorobiales bacterium]
MTTQTYQTQTYQINGMHCGSCVARVRKALSAVVGVESATVTLRPAEAVITSQEPLDARALNAAVQEAGNYSLTRETESPTKEL